MPQVHPSSPPPAAGQSSPHAAAVAAAPTPRRYDTRAGPSLPHP